MDHHLSSVSYTYEIFVVNGGSTDNTGEVVRNMMPTIKNLKLIDAPDSHGKGSAVRKGMLAAQGEIRLFTDADNATTIDHFDRMMPYFSGLSDPQNPLSPVRKKYDVVICSRAMKGSVMDPAEPWYRQIPGKMGNLWIQLFVLPGLWDTQCGFKAFTAEATEQIFGLSRFAGWSFDIEILALAREVGFRIAEVPVHWRHDGNSKISLGAYLEVLFDVLKIRWMLWMDVYRLKHAGKQGLPGGGLSPGQ